MSHTPRQTPRTRREVLAAQQAAEAARQRNNRIVIGVISVLVLALVAGLVTWTIKRRDDKATTPVTSATAVSDPSTKPANAATDGLGLVYANGNAAATTGVPVLIEYQDYQCSACKQYHSFYGDALKQLALQGKIVYELRTLTFLDTAEKNTSSSDAANAAACAAEAGHYADMFEVIYANSPSEGTAFTAQQLRVDWPTKAGITGSALTSYQACYDARKYSGFVKAVDQAGMNAGVSQTPTFLVNGKQFDLSASKGTADAVLAAIKAAA